MPTDPEALAGPSTPPPAPPVMPHWRRNVGAFLGGQTASLFGSMLVQYAVFWYITIQFQSGVMMMLAVVFGFLPQALVSIVGGVWADRYNRKRLVILADATTAGYVSDLVEGLRYVAGHGVVRWVLMLFAIVFVLTVAPSTLTPLLVVRSFPSDEQGNVFNLAVLEMAFAGGMVVGGLLVAALASTWDRVKLIAGSSLVFGALSIALGLAPSVWLFVVIMLAVGLAVPFFSTPSMTLLQETVDPERQGRVFGLLGIVMAVATPVGIVILGPLADVVPIEAIMIGTGLLTFVVIAVAVWSPPGRRAVAAVHATPRTDQAGTAGDPSAPPAVPTPESR